MRAKKTFLLKIQRQNIPLLPIIWFVSLCLHPQEVDIIVHLVIRQRV